MLQPMKNKIIGISYASVCEMKESNLLLLNSNYKCIEIPAGSDQYMDAIISKYCKNDVEYAVHYPSQHSVEKLGFTFADKDIRKKIYEDFTKYVEKYENAAYYLIHFPDFQSDDSQIGVLIEYLKELRNCIGYRNEKLVIENLTSCTAQTYKRLIDESDVDLCLDLGHAHLRDEKEIDTFFDLLTDRIKVVHYYNTTCDEKNIYYGKHLPPSYEVEFGINIDCVNDNIRKINHKMYLINEQIGVEAVNEFLSIEW